MNSFAFYSGHIKQCLNGMVNANKNNIEKLFMDNKNKDESHLNNED